MYRLAILHPSHPVSDLTENSGLNYYREFFLELRRLGYIEGKNLVVERFSGEGRVDHYPELAREAAARNPNVVFAITPWMVRPLKEATSTVPIVAVTGDPVQAGLVTSMARPGGDRLPAIYPYPVFVEAGGLMSYGTDLVEVFRQGAREIDQILKGANPGEIPFYQPIKFELVINLKAAKEIGLTVSEPLLARADEVIE